MLCDRQGTSLSQDFRFSNKQKKRLAKLNCSKLLKKKVLNPANSKGEIVYVNTECTATIYFAQVDTKKVALPVIFKWIAEKITQILGFSDEVVIRYVQNTLESSRVRPKIGITYCSAFFYVVCLSRISSMHPPS